MKLGIFGGSFDPVHLGHLLVARAAIEELALDRLFFVPTALSPFKVEKQHAPGGERLRWLRLALAGRADCEVDDQEIRRGGQSYTIATLRDYAKRFPDAQLFYLIGADNVSSLPQWREAEELARLAKFLAVPRPGEPEKAFPAPFRGRYLKGFPLALSSSLIRARVKAGLAIDHLAPPGVADAIHAGGFYR